MKNTWLMAVVAWLVLSAAACKKENQAEQLAALDGAYQAGVLSKAEYDAKRLALMGPPPAAPVTPAPATNPAAPPQAAPSPVPRKPAPVVTQPQAAPPERRYALPSSAPPAP